MEGGVELWSAYFFLYLLEFFGPPLILWLAILGFFTDPAYEGVPDLKKAVSILKEAVSNLEVAVSNLKEAVSNLKEAVTDLKEAISNLEEAISSLKEAVSNLKEAISNLEEVVSNLKEAVPHPARHSLRILFVASVLYIAGMSFQPHKEWRLIVYVLPVFTLQAANGFANLSCLRNAKFLSKLKMLSLIGACLLTAENSLFNGYVSSYNFPGAEALNFANSQILRIFKTHPALVHMDVASCISGINRFGQLHNGLAIYDKTESKVELLKIWNDVDILITETNIEEINADIDTENIYSPGSWIQMGVVPSYNGIAVNPVMYLALGLTYKRLLPNLLRKSLNEVKKGKFTTIVRFFRSLIQMEDYIYVYLRIEADEGLENKLENELKRLESDENAENNLGLREEEEILLGLKDHKLNEINPDDIREEINQDIDEMESLYIES